MTKSTSVEGSTLSFHDIKYTVKVKPPGKACAKAEPKEIIHNVSGIFKPGVNAILGATGSGKTSLLDIMAGRKDPAGCEGTILVNGKRQPRNFKCMSGYVVQDDVVMGTLTVRENFMFSANLRLPKTISQEEKRRRVDDTIAELGLIHCAESKVGTEIIRGVSGGERKRTNIGMELIISPSVLFLDEPTTGLDASTANAVVLLLHRLGRKGRTIVFSIHQPRYSIYKLFDRLTLLSKGHMVYHGAGAEALEYFSSIGYECEAHNNPPDFFLDIINGDSSAVQLAVSGETDVDAEIISEPGKAEEGGDPNYIQFWEDKSKSNEANGDVAVELSEDPEKEAALAVQLSNQFQSSTWSKNLDAEISDIFQGYESSQDQKDEVVVEGAGYTTSFYTQLYYVSQRALLNIWRNPQTSIMQILVMIIFGVLVGVIYWQIDDGFTTGLQNRVGAFFFIIMNQVFGNLSAVELFIKERVIFIHENSNGFYRMSSYFVAKVFCDLLPMRLLPTIFFCTIVYFMIGFQVDVAKFFIFVLSIFMVGFCAAALGFLFSASVSVFAIANLLIALCYVFMMVFSGLLVNLETMLDWIVWIKYFSIFRYALNALNINELKGQKYCSFSTAANRTMCDYGNDYLTAQGVKFETDWDMWQNIFALMVMTVIFLALGYVQLRRIQKYK